MSWQPAQRGRRLPRKLKKRLHGTWGWWKWWCGVVVLDANALMMATHEVGEWHTLFGREDAPADGRQP